MVGNGIQSGNKLALLTTGNAPGKLMQSFPAKRAAGKVLDSRHSADWANEDPDGNRGMLALADSTVATALGQTKRSEVGGR